MKLKLRYIRFPWRFEGALEESRPTWERREPERSIRETERCKSPEDGPGEGTGSSGRDEADAEQIAKDRDSPPLRVRQLPITVSRLGTSFSHWPELPAKSSPARVFSRRVAFLSFGCSASTRVKSWLDKLPAP